MSGKPWRQGTILLGSAKFVQSLLLRFETLVNLTCAFFNQDDFEIEQNNYTMTDK